MNGEKKMEEEESFVTAEPVEDDDAILVSQAEEGVDDVDDSLQDLKVVTHVV